MRYLLNTSLIVLSLMIASCGVGGDNSISSNTTPVVISLGQRVNSAGVVSAQAIPASVSYIRFYISAPDMSSIEQSVNVTGIDNVEEIFEISNGSDRYFEVFAYDSEGRLRYKGDTYADLNGTPTSVTVTMVSISDETPPTFGGVVTATAVSSTEIDLSWTAATDDYTLPSDIVYLIYILTTSGDQNFLRLPDFTTAGATTYRVTGLFASTTYYFVVRAKDVAGNVDNNTIELLGATQTPPDSILPTFGGVSIATAASGTEIDLSWTAATDNVTASSNIVYLIYISTISGGQDFLGLPDFTTAAGATTYRVTGLFASTTYYFVVRAKDVAGNVDNNTIELLGATQTPPDSIPPTFGGVLIATAASGMRIDLSWTAATDNVTALSNIVYLIYISTISGGQDFLSHPNFTITAGDTAHRVRGLNFSTTYYFVVRAKDEAGNVEQNAVEVSATMGCNCGM